MVQEGRVDGCDVVQEGRVDGGKGVLASLSSGDGGKELVLVGQEDVVPSSTIVSTTSTHENHRRQTLGALVMEVGPTLKWQDKDRL